ncbi:MAG: hypothetical protein AAGD96_28305, partial [Chloroflexota bacterium]
MREKPHEKKTVLLLILSYLINEPLFTVYGFSAIILSKTLGANEFLIAFFLSIKPVMSILSFYWSSRLHKRPDRLKVNFLAATLLARAPFLLLPLFPNAWYLIFSASIYLLFYRAAKPAWLEILKNNVSENKKKTAFSWGFSLAYLEGMLLAFFVGYMLDTIPAYWPWLFFGGAVIGCSYFLF